MSQQKPGLVALRDEREKTIKMLVNAFAADLFDVDEFESRVDKAHQAESCEALEVLRQDIEPVTAAGKAQPASTALAVNAETQQALIEARPETRWVISAMGGAERKGNWRVPRTLRVGTVMGGASVDFREALLAPGVTQVKVLACMGGVEIIVPPHLAVECEGIGIMGGFESLDRCTVVADPDRPLLRITGVAIMGGVEVSTRLAGESARRARKRRRLERKAREKGLKEAEQPKQLR